MAITVRAVYPGYGAGIAVSKLQRIARVCNRYRNKNKQTYAYEYSNYKLECIKYKSNHHTTFHAIDNDKYLSYMARQGVRYDINELFKELLI